MMRVMKYEQTALCKSCLLLRHGSIYVLGGCRKGGADKLLSIAIGSFIPGVSLNNEFLPSQTQTTPADGQR